MDFKGFYDKIIFDVDMPILRKYTGKQGDTKSRGLYVTVTQRNVVIKDLTGLSMRLFYEKPDKTRGFIDGVVDGNEFRIDYTNQMFAVPGVVKAELRFMGANGEGITDKAFKISVDSSIADGSIVSKDERGILDRAFELAESVIPRLELLDVELLEDVQDIIPRLELLDVELLEGVQDEMLGARYSGTKDAPYDSLGQRLDASDQDLLDHKAEYTSSRRQDQLKIAKVEKELNNYKSVMSQVNINQEAKQSASGYGTISLPPNAANGQVSVIVGGETRTNLLGNKGACENPDDFSVKVAYTNVIVENGRMKITIPSAGSAYRGIPIALDSSKHYFIRGTIAIANGNLSSGIMFRVKNSNGYIGDETYYKETININRGIKIQPSNITENMSVGVFIQSNDKQYGYVDNIAVYEINEEEYNTMTEEELLQKYTYINDTKSTICTTRLKSVNEDKTKENTLYVIAKDEEGNILELHSLPNGVKDEISVSDGKVIINTGKSLLDGSEDWEDRGLLNNGLRRWSARINTTYKSNGYNLIEILCDTLPVQPSVSAYDKARDYGICIYESDNNIIYLTLNDGETPQSVLSQKPATLTYQVAEPIVTPININVSGNLISYPSGTVYVENVVADAGIYKANGIGVLHQELPIDSLDKLSKIDFETGLETELDTSQAVISEDGTYFTHPELVEGDIVFFEYYYPSDMTTQGETEIEYYDSRYVIKDSVTGKFYKWQITVTNGVPSIELKEV